MAEFFMIKKILITLGLVSVMVTLAAQTPKRTISHESLWLMKRVGAPVPSPDGRMVVVAVTAPAYDAKEQ